MVRSVVSKIMLVGRATVFMVGLAVVLALVFGAATAALGAPITTFKLGQINTSNAISTLVGAVSGSNLKIENTGTGANATALELKVAQGNAPLAVNADAGKATNLNADKVDGQEASSFATQAGLNNEVATRASAYQNLQSSLDQEASARQNADNALGQGDGAANQPSDPVDFTKVKNIPADVINRNADTIDGKDSSEFLGANQKAADSDKLDGIDSAGFAGTGRSSYDVFTSLTPCTEQLLRSQTISPSRPALVYAIGTAVYNPGTTNLLTGTLDLELRNAATNTTLAGGGTTFANGNGAEVPLSVQGVLISGNNSNAVYNSSTPFEVTPGNNYVLRLVGNATNGSCAGSDQFMRTISLSYVLVGK
jgi:hypothetical protein